MNLRIIPKLDIKNENLVKGVNLEGLRSLGDPKKFAEIYYSEGADELIYHDVVASLYERNSAPELIKKTSSNIFLPMLVGGGINSLKEVERVLKSGADRIFINTAAINKHKFIDEIIKFFGASTLVVSVEVVKKEKLFYCRKDFGREQTNLELSEWCKKIQDKGVAEIMVTSIDQDGTGNGFDLNIVKILKKSINIPYILNGGFAKLKHFEEVLNIDKPSGFAISSVFHYNKLEKISDKENYTDGNFVFLKQKSNYNNFKPLSIRKIKKFLTQKFSAKFKE